MHMRTILLASLTACTAAGAGGPTAGGPTADRASPRAPVTTADDNPPGEYRYTTERTGGVHDFDSIAGAWTLANRRLKARWVGSKEWDEFPAVDCGAVYLGGVVNVDELHFPTKGWGGVTFRTFDVEKRQWSIYWVNSRNGKMFPPVVGGFDGDRGEFYGHDTLAERPVIYRYLWTRLGADQARWEQAFTEDGHAWTTNWIMTFTRR
jgi:hypothetical protein